MSSLREIWVADYGVAGDGTDEAAKIQLAIDATSGLGGAVVRFHDTTQRFAFATGLTIPDGVSLRGQGKYSTRLRYTGTVTAISAPAGTSTNHSISISDLTLQLVAGNGATGIDAKWFISSTFRSLRIASTGAATGLTGVIANIDNTGQHSFYNVFEDCTWDGLATAVKIDSGVAQYANRWRLVAPTFLSCGDCLDIVNVKGIQVVAPYFNEHTGTAIKLGLSVDRAIFVAAVQETSSGGTMFNIDAGASRVSIIGYESFAGTLGLGSPAQIGKRGTLIGSADTGLQLSGTTAGTILSRALVQDAVGAQYSGVEGISGTLTESKNLRGSLTISGTNVSGTVTFTNAEPDTSYYLTVTPTTKSGSPAADSMHVESISKSTGSFTVTLKAAPGAGTSRDFDWHLIR